MIYEKCNGYEKEEAPAGLKALLEYPLTGRPVIIPVVSSLHL
jgi:hypothetical protein